VRLDSLVVPLPDTPRISLQIGARTDDQGRFAIPRVPPGEFVVYPVIQNTYCRGALVTVQPGTTQRVDLVVGGGRAITGRFVWSEPGVQIHWHFPAHQFSLRGRPREPAPAGTVETARNNQGGLVSLNFAVGPDGSFRVDAIPEGTYRLEAGIGKENPDDPQVVSMPFRPRGTTAREVVVKGIEGGGDATPLDLGVLEVKRLEPMQEEAPFVPAPFVPK